jgi:hypothetical protein
MKNRQISGYQYAGSGVGHHHAYLLPSVAAILAGLDLPLRQQNLWVNSPGSGSFPNV